MARIWNTPVFVLAAVYFVVDGVFSRVTRPITGLPKEDFRANATLGNFFRALSFASAFRRAGNHPRAGKTFGRVFVGNRSFLRWRRHLHHGGSSKAHIRRAAVSTQSRQAPVDPSVRLGISILASHDGRGRIDGSLEVCTKTGGQCRTHGADPMDST